MAKTTFGTQMEAAGFVWNGEWKSWVKTWFEGSQEYELIFELTNIPNIWEAAVYRNKELIGDKVKISSLL